MLLSGVCVCVIVTPWALLVVCELIDLSLSLSLSHHTHTHTHYHTQEMLSGTREALRAYLREFVDHKIVKVLKQAGRETLLVDIPEADLQRLVTELEESG